MNSVAGNVARTTPATNRQIASTARASASRGDRRSARAIGMPRDEQRTEGEPAFIRPRDRHNQQECRSGGNDSLRPVKGPAKISDRGGTPENDGYDRLEYDVGGTEQRA